MPNLRPSIVEISRFCGMPLALLFCASLAHAADTLPAAPFAPLAIDKASGLKVEKLELLIEGREARYTFDVKNTRATSVLATVSFTLPRFAWNGMSDDYFDKDFPELQIEVDAKPIRPAVISRAYVTGKEVTGILKQAGFAPTMVASSSPEGFPSADGSSTGKIQKLISQGMFEERNGTLFPLWAASVKYQWQQSFRGRSHTRISYNYTLRPGFGITEIDDEMLKKAVESNCGSLPQLQTMVAAKQPSPRFFLYEEFVIPFSTPSPELADIKFIPRPLNDSFVPIASFGCIGDGLHRNAFLDVGFSAMGKKTPSFKFVLISYQKTGLASD